MTRTLLGEGEGLSSGLDPGVGTTEKNFGIWNARAHLRPNYNSLFVALLDPLLSMDGGTAPLNDFFSQNQTRSKAPSLREALDALPEASLSKLKSRLGRDKVEELLSISSDPNLEMLLTQVKDWAYGLETDHLPEAVFLYSQLEAWTQRRWADAPSEERSYLAPLLEGFRERLSLFRGEGSSGLKAERFFQEFSDQVIDPAMFAVLLLGGISSRATRFWTMRGLWANPEARALLGGTGIRLGSELVAFACEVPTVTLSSRGLAWALGKKPSLEWTQDLGNTALLLGSLRLAHATVSSSLRGIEIMHEVGGMPIQSPMILTQKLLPELASLGGLALARGLQQKYSSPSSEGLNLFEIFSSYLHFKVAGHFASELGGTSLRQLELSLDAAVRMPQNLPGNFPRFPMPQLQVAGITQGWVGFGFPEAESVHRTGNAFATKLGEKLERANSFLGRGGAAAKTEVPPEVVVPPFSTREEKLVAQIAERIQLPDFSALLARTSVASAEGREFSLARMAHLVRHANPEMARGGYLNWLTKVGLSSIATQGKVDALAQVLETLEAGGSVQDYEALFAKNLPFSRIPPVPSPLFRVFGKQPELEQIRSLGLTPESTKVLFNGWFAQKYKIGDAKFAVNMQEFLDTLSPLASETNLSFRLDRALKNSALSPLGLLRLHHLHNILRSEEKDGLASKLRELGDPTLRIVKRDGGFRGETSTQVLPETQANGYFRYPRMTALFTEMEERIPELLDPARSSRAKEDRRKILEDFWQNRRKLGALDQKEIISIFKRFKDPISQALVYDLEAKPERLNLIPVHGNEVFRTMMQFVLKGAPYDYKNTMAFHVLPGILGPTGTIVVKQNHWQPYTLEEKCDQLFKVLFNIVHEYEHSQHRDAKEAQTRGVHLRQEMLAVGREILWRGEHGDTRWLEQIQNQGAMGKPLYLRDFVEHWYYDSFDQMKAAAAAAARNSAKKID